MSFKYLQANGWEKKRSSNFSQEFLRERKQLTDGSKYCEAEHEAGAEGPDLMSGLPAGVALPDPLHGASLEVLDDGRYQGPGQSGLQHIVGHWI